EVEKDLEAAAEKTEEAGNWDASADANAEWSATGAAGNDVAALANSGNWDAAAEGDWAADGAAPAADWAAEGAANSGWSA
ncbi:hypothetical protein EC988_006498, partial [Linderina pennispora]